MVFLRYPNLLRLLLKLIKIYISNLNIGISCVLVENKGHKRYNKGSLKVPILMRMYFWMPTNLQWEPPSLAEVSKDMVDCYFSPLSELEPELELPVASREPNM